MRERKFFAERVEPNAPVNASIYSECLRMAKERLARLKAEQPNVEWTVCIDGVYFTEAQLLAAGGAL